jgi:hypothetical protein
MVAPQQPMATSQLPQPFNNMVVPNEPRQTVFRSGNKTITNTTEIKNNDQPDFKMYISELQDIIKELISIQKNNQAVQQAVQQRSEVARRFPAGSTGSHQSACQRSIG